MPTTAELRELWAPHCVGPFARITLHGGGVITVRESTAEAWLALNDILVAFGYKTRKEDTGAYNCRTITGGRGYSLHAYAIASDLNWKTNPYGSKLITDMPPKMIEAIEALRTNSGHPIFRWGGRYSGNKDAMHFEIICTPAQLATGVLRPAPKPPVPVVKKDKKEKSMEAALQLIKMHYDNARSGGKRTYDVETDDPSGYQHWVTQLLDAYDKGTPLKAVTDQLGVALYLEIQNKKK